MFGSNFWVGTSQTYFTVRNYPFEYVMKGSASSVTPWVNKKDGMRSTVKSSSTVKTRRSPTRRSITKGQFVIFTTHASKVISKWNSVMMENGLQKGCHIYLPCYSPKDLQHKQFKMIIISILPSYETFHQGKRINHRFHLFIRSNMLSIRPLQQFG